MLKNVVTLGVTIALMVAMTATVAAAQPDKAKAYGYGLERQPICHKGKTLYLPKPAIGAHLGHGDTSGVCDEVVVPPPEGPSAECENPVGGVEIVSTDDTNVQGVVDIGDVLSITGNFELAASGTISVTVQDTDGTQGTFENGVNVEITQQGDGSLLITVMDDPINVAGGDNVLSTTGLEGVSSEGITCAEEVEGTTGTTEAVDDTVLQATLSASALPTEQVTDQQGPPEPFGHPFCDYGWEYAQEHIRAMAQNQTPGLTGPPTPRSAEPEDEHVPGFHQGFAVCDPSDNE